MAGLSEIPGAPGAAPLRTTPLPWAELSILDSRRRSSCTGVLRRHATPAAQGARSNPARVARSCTLALLGCRRRAGCRVRAGPALPLGFRSVSDRQQFRADDVDQARSTVVHWRLGGRFVFWGSQTSAAAAAGGGPGPASRRPGKRGAPAGAAARSCACPRLIGPDVSEAGAAGYGLC
jgi:hypothetical protein